MCGIYFYQGSARKEELKNQSAKIQYRGPDSSNTIVNLENFFSFHRLAINGLSDKGNQPFTKGELTMVCNGEIYNHKELETKYKILNKTGSDCEVVLEMFDMFGIEKTVKQLDGVFMFVIHDSKNNRTYAARDAFGVRPGFLGTGFCEFGISSEAKTLLKTFPGNVKPFLPGTWWDSKQPLKFNKWYDRSYTKLNKEDSYFFETTKNSLVNAVRKRLLSEREIGCLLSGGLDSSLIASLVRRESGKKIKTFSVGMPGSIDLEYAEKVAKFIDSDHHSVEISAEDFLNAIEEVIYKIESYDTTTVRASVGNFLISKYISENTDVKVVFNGDGSDEVCSGYIYGRNAPTPNDLYKDSERLLKEIYLYDVLRSDRSISSNGLEPRTPFLDKEFVNSYMSIPGENRVFDGKNRIEKYILRKSFEPENLLPNEVLWRKKCAFSDGVSDIKKSWHKIIQGHVDAKISDKEFKKYNDAYIHCQPFLKESFYYRKVFEDFFGKESENLIPSFWMPKWTNVQDPSAREIPGYNE